MLFCSRCLKYIDTSCAVNLCPKRKVILATNRELCRRSHFQRLAIASRALNLPRREFPNWMADTIFGFEGEFFSSEGDAFDVDDEDIDAAFNDDGSFRWLSDFLVFADLPPRQRPQWRIIERLRLIDLAFRIAHPERAAWIAK